MDGIGDDLAGKRLHALLAEVGLTRGTAEEGISMEPMAPFLSSLASKKTLLRKCVDDFSERVKAVSRYLASIISLSDVLMTIGTLS